jgi:NADH-quinone oxidoreductase subunit K
MSYFEILILSLSLFFIGLLGITLNRKSLINIMMSIELILLAAQINFVCLANQLNDLSGQVFSIFVLSIAAAEAAIGLAIIVAYYKNHHNIQVEKINELKG